MKFHELDPHRNGDNVEHEEPNALDASRVELATLTLPAIALDTGIESGGGGEVVLRASQETVDYITDSTPRVASSTTSAVAGLHDGTTTCIQAVIDLQKLSELVHMDEDDFVAGLHREANEEPFQLNQIEEEDDDDLVESTDTEDGNISLQETTPYPDEEQALLPKTEERDESTGIDEVTLAVDAFVDTLAEVLPTQTADGVSIISEDRDDIFSQTITTDVRATTTEVVENNAHLGHDAFLLEIPDQNPSIISGKRLTGEHHHHQQSHFVLALPEIQLDIPSDISELTTIPLLERAMSFLPTQLPTDIEDVQLDATTLPVKSHPGTTEVHLDLVVKRKVPLIGYILLIAGLVALSSVGAALDLQGGDVSAMLKAYWRLCATSLCLSPFAIQRMLRDGKPKLTKQQWIALPLSAFAYAYATTSFVVSLECTTLANAFVLSNMTPLVIIVGKGIVGLPILAAEISGVIIGLVGGMICAADPSSQHQDSLSNGGDVNLYEVEEQSYGLLGNLIAFSSSFGTAMYIVLAKNLRTSMDLLVFMFWIMTMASFFLLGFMMLSRETLLLSADPNYGLWGWLNPRMDRLVLELFMAIVCNMVGSMGYVAVLKYFDSVVVSTVMLMEPVVGTLLAVAVGVSILPGTQTFIGDVVVIIGSFLVLYSGSRKTESIDATEALRTKAVAPSSLTKDVQMPSTFNKIQTNAPEVLNSPIMRRPQTRNSDRKGEDAAQSDDANINRACVVWE